MHRRGSWIAGSVAVALFIVALWGAPSSLWNVFLNPWRMLWGSRHPQATLIDLPEAQPVRAAGRKLLKPFGMLRLNRVIDPQDTESNS